MKPSRLVWIAVVLVSLASGAVVLDWFYKHRESPEFLGLALMGPLDMREAGIVLIETAGGQVTIRRTHWGWTVDEQNGFAADTGKVRALLLKLARTPITDRLHVRPQKLGELGLLQKVENDWRFEAGKTASVFSIIMGVELRHKLMYQVLIGNRRPGSGTYIRFPVSNTAYLVSEEVFLDGDAANWIERRIFEDDAAGAMRRIAIRQPGGNTLAFDRAKPHAAWTLVGGRAPVRQERVDELARALVALRIATVGAPGAAQALHAPAATVVISFFDDRTVELTLHDLPPAAAERPASLVARGPQDEASEVARWVEVFNHRFGGRSLTVDGALSERLLQRRAAYLAGR